jgi:hypothetical protein
MTEWLAVILFCVNGTCAFWAENTKPFYSQQDCEKALLVMDKYLIENGATATIPGCIPLKFTRV